MMHRHLGARVYQRAFMEDALSNMSSGLRPFMDRIFIVDDYPVFRQGYTEMISGASGMEVCGTAASFDEAQRAIPDVDPDLVLVDISLGNDSPTGFALIERFSDTLEDVQWLVVSAHDESERVEHAFDVGAHGFLSKQKAVNMLCSAIRAVLGGKSYVETTNR